MIIFVGSNSAINSDIKSYLKMESRYLGHAEIDEQSISGELFYINREILSLIKATKNDTLKLSECRKMVSRYGEGLYAEALLL